MKQIVFGQHDAGKTTTTKRLLQETITSHAYDHIVILDLKNEYKELNSTNAHILMLNEVGLHASNLSLRNIALLNAGYLTDGSRVLLSNAESVIADYRDSFPHLKGKKVNELLDSLPKEGLLDDTLERMSFSWSESELEYLTDYLQRRIPSKKNNKQMTFHDALNDVMSHKVTVLRTKNTNSYHVRALLYLLLDTLSRLGGRVCFVGDDALNLLSNGNMKLLANHFSIEGIDYLFTAHKAEHIFPSLLEDVEEVLYHTCAKKKELDEMIAKNLLDPLNAKKILTLKNYKTIAVKKEVNV